MQPQSPYKDQKKNTILALAWFFIAGALTGLGAYFMAPSVQTSTDPGMTMILVLGAIAVVMAVIGFMVGVRGVQQARAKSEFETDSFKSKLFVAGSFFLAPVLIGAIAVILTKTWVIFGVGLILMAGIVFGLLIPAASDMYAKLELALQRKRDGGVPATSKKTTYEL